MCWYVCWSMLVCVRANMYVYMRWCMYVGDDICTYTCVQTWMYVWVDARTFLWLTNKTYAQQFRIHIPFMTIQKSTFSFCQQPRKKTASRLLFKLKCWRNLGLLWMLSIRRVCVVRQCNILSLDWGVVCTMWTYGSRPDVDTQSGWMNGYYSFFL